MTLRFSSLFVIASSWLVALACSAGGNGNTSGVRGSAGSGNIDPGTGGTVSINPGGGTPDGMRDPTDTRNVPVRAKVCDAAGNCTCLRLALLGTLVSSAHDADTQPFVDWLNGHTNNSATVTMISTKPTLDADFLSKYDILLVANVNTWTFSATEQAAVANWVKTTGGGIISLTGFTSMPGEPAATSQLISFAGLSYGSTTTAPNPPSETLPVYYKGGATNVKQCLRWNNPADQQDPQITAPIHFTPQPDSLEKLTASLDYVGAFYGWNVNAPSGATVIGTDPASMAPIAVAYEYMGAGRIFAWGDEWVILKNQWQKAGMPNNMQMDMYNPCWVPASGATPGFFLSAESVYQTKQFWYDVINWVAPPNVCDFKVVDPDVVIK